jgi:hypothetical protein
VVEKNYKLKSAAKDLSINYSTAKTIIRIWRLENRINKKNTTNFQKNIKIEKSKAKQTCCFDDLQISMSERINLGPHKCARRCAQKVFGIKKCQVDAFSIKGNALEVGAMKSGTEHSGLRTRELTLLRLVIIYHIRTLQKGFEEQIVINNRQMLDYLFQICNEVILRVNNTAGYTHYSQLNQEKCLNIIGKLKNHP